MRDNGPQNGLAQLASHVPSWLTVLALLSTILLFVTGSVVLIIGASTGKVAEAFGIKFRPGGAFSASVSYFDPVPVGAVMAFDLRSGCPTGWEQFDAANGRFILGAGQGDGLTFRPAYSSEDPKARGGQERVTLTDGQMPVHFHATTHHAGKNDNRVFGSTVSDQQTTGYFGISSNEGKLHPGSSFKTSTAGSALSHENMPPFIALHFCKKVT